MLLLRTIAPALLACQLALAGCAAGSPVGSACESGSECESGACNEGVCVDASGGGAGGGVSAGGEAAGAGSSAGGSSAGGAGVGGGISCTQNLDGTIERAEVPIAAGLHATFKVATNVTFSTAPGSVNSEPTWDLSGALSGDHSVLLETLPLSGQWFAGTFPSATYASKLADGQDLLGVFEVTDDALLLLGVVSPADGVTRTELSYDPPVVVLQFPLTTGASWTTTSTITGLTSGVFSTYFESYDSSVDQAGTIITPFSSFEGLRVRTDLTRTVGALISTQRTFAFVTECFGTVGAISSQLNELSSSEFTSVSEIKRLSP